MAFQKRSWRTCVIIFQAVSIKHCVIFESIFRPIFLPCSHIPSVWKWPELSHRSPFPFRHFSGLKYQKISYGHSSKIMFLFCSSKVPLPFRFLCFVHCTHIKETSLKRKILSLLAGKLEEIKEFLISLFFMHFLEMRHMRVLFFQNGPLFQ